MYIKTVLACKTILFLLVAIIIYDAEGYAQEVYTGFHLELIPEREEIYAYEMASFTVRALNFGDEVRNVYISLSDPENNYSKIIGGTKWMITVAPGETKEFKFSVIPKYLVTYQMVTLKYNFSRYSNRGEPAVVKIKILDAEELSKALKAKKTEIEKIPSLNVTIFAVDTVTKEEWFLDPIDSSSIIYDLNPSDKRDENKD